MSTLLQITIDGNMGSTGRIAEAIGNLAISRGWESYIAHGRYARPSKSNIIQIGTHYDILMHGLQTRLLDRHGLGSEKATIELVNQINKISPDVIQLHNIHGYYINMEVLFHYLSKTTIPIIWTFHDCWSFTGHCSHFEFVNCEKWKTECHHCPQKREYPASYLIDRSRKNFQLKKELFTSVSNMTIVPVSNWLNHLVRDSFLGHLPSHVIYNGIDLDIFAPATNQKALKKELNLGEGFLILGVAGVWPKQKGIDDFIKISEQIDKDDYIVLVGLEPSQIKNLPANIIGITRTENREKLKNLYGAADVYVNPTLADSFPTTNLEALACGTPVITYKTGGSPEAIDVSTGIVVKKSDINGLLNAIEKVKKNGKAFYTEACRARALRYFDKNDRFAEYIDLYEKVLQKNNSQFYQRSTIANSTSFMQNNDKKKQEKDYQICTNCIMDTSDPHITFDERGWCDYCHNFHENILPNWHPDERGLKELMKIAEKIKKEGKGKEFDCIIGLSGGPDSSYVAYVAKEIMGIRPLLFHVDAGWNTQQAVSNIEKLVDGLGQDLYTEVINWEEMKDLQVAYFKSQIANMDDPQDIAFFSGMYKFARKYNIKYVLTGANFSTECCREPEEWGAYPGIDKRLVMDIHKKFGKIPLKSFPVVDIFTYKIFFKYVLGMQIIKPLNYVPYFKKDAEELLSKKFGWEKFQHKHHESRFTRFYEDYWLPRKFGYEKRRAHFSSLILTNQMTRDEALERISKPEMSEEFLKQEFEYVANKLGLSVDELQSLFEEKNKTFYDYKNKRSLIGLGARAMKILGLEKRLFR